MTDTVAKPPESSKVLRLAERERERETEGCLQLPEPSRGVSLLQEAQESERAGGHVRSESGNGTDPAGGGAPASRMAAITFHGVRRHQAQNP